MEEGKFTLEEGKFTLEEGKFTLVNLLWRKVNLKSHLAEITYTSVYQFTCIDCPQLVLLIFLDEFGKS